jgi:hypothetical protein
MITQLLGLPLQCAKQHHSLATVYDKMTQLIELMPKDTRTSVPDQITLLMRCVQDAEVRRERLSQ